MSSTYEYTIVLVELKMQTGKYICKNMNIAFILIPTAIFPIALRSPLLIVYNRFTNLILDVIVFDRNTIFTFQNPLIVTTKI